MKIYEYIVRIKDQASDRVGRLARSSNSANSSIQRLGSTVDRSRDKLGRFTAEARQAAESSNNMGSMASLAARYIGPAFLIAALSGATVNASKLAMQMEQTGISFQVMLGNASEANSMLGELTSLANVTPFTRTELQDSAKLLLNFGVAGKKVLPTVKMLGDISGGNAYKMHLMTLAFAQMSAAGRLMGQDLLQMVNAGFNPLQEISRKTGISMAILKKKMEDGAISTKMVEAAFRSATSEGGRFFGMMDKQSATFEGRLSTLRDKMEIWSAGMGKTINDFLSPFLDSAINKIDMLLNKGNAMNSMNARELHRIQKINTELKPLLERYESLRFKDMRTAGENSEMLGIISKVKQDFPQIMRARDGKMTDVSLMKGRDFIRDENRMFEESNRTKIDVLTKELDRVGLELAMAKATVEKPNQFMGAKKAQEFRLEALKATVELEQEHESLLNSILQLEKSIGKVNDPITIAAAAPDDATAFDDLKKGVKADEEKALSKITGGGKQSVNVTINLENLIGQQNFDVKNVKESVRDVQALVTEALLRVVSSANYAAAQ